MTRLDICASSVQIPCYTISLDRVICVSNPVKGYTQNRRCSSSVDSIGSRLKLLLIPPTPFFLVYTYLRHTSTVLKRTASDSKESTTQKVRVLGRAGPRRTAYCCHVTAVTLWRARERVMRSAIPYRKQNRSTVERNHSARMQGGELNT